MNGVLLIDKPSGMTSHDVVFKARKILGTKRIGHTGTLDKEVTGVLVLVVGEGTKLTELLQERPKGYSATVALGYATTTEDSHGEVTAKSDVSSIEESAVDIAIESFNGEYNQMVPLYSSVKVDGKKLYQYALNNEDVERPVRKVHIYILTRTSDLMTDGETKSFDIHVKCSKGTYIRTLAVDIGRKLNVHSHMSKLKRTESCGFTIEQCVSLEEAAVQHIIPLEEVLKNEFTVNLSDDPELYFRIKNGQKLPLDRTLTENNDRILFINDERLIGLYHKVDEDEQIYRPYKMFNL